MDSSDLQDILELREITHYTTLQKAAHRLTNKKTLDMLMKKMLVLSIKAKILKKVVALGAFLRARTYFAQMREIMFKLFTYNVMVVES